MKLGMCTEGTFSNTGWRTKCHTIDGARNTFYYKTI